MRRRTASERTIPEEIFETAIQYSLRIEAAEGDDAHKQAVADLAEWCDQSPDHAAAARWADEHFDSESDEPSDCEQIEQPDAFGMLIER